MVRVIAALVGAMMLFSTGQATATDIDIGPITIRNDFDVEIVVIVYHADNIDEAFASYRIKAGESLQLEQNGKPYNIGGDWLIQVEPTGKDPSKRRLVYKVAEFKDKAFTVRAKVAFTGK